MTDRQLTGGDVNYYLVDVPRPKRLEPYRAECEDIIEALGMNFAEGCAFKAIWRKAAARQGNGKPGSTALYDAEKVAYYGDRLVAQELRAMRLSDGWTDKAIKAAVLPEEQCPLCGAIVGDEPHHPECLRWKAP